MIPETFTDMLPETFCDMKEKRERIIARRGVRPAEHTAPNCPAGFCLIGTPKVKQNTRLIGFKR